MIKPIVDLDNNQRKKLKQVQLELLDVFVTFCKEHNLTYYLLGGTLLGAIRHHGYIPWDDDIDVCMPIGDYLKLVKDFDNSSKYYIDNRESNRFYFHHYSKLTKRDTVYIEYSIQKTKWRQGIFLDIFPIYYVPENKNFSYYLFYFKLYILNRRATPKFLIPPGTIMKKKTTSKIADVISWILLWWCPRSLAAKWRDSFLYKHTIKKTSVVSVGLNLGRRRPVKLFEGRSSVQFEGRLLDAPKLAEENLIACFGMDYMTPPKKENQIPHHYVVEFKA